AEQALVLENGFVSAHMPMAFACRKVSASAKPTIQSSGRGTPPARPEKNGAARPEGPPQGVVASSDGDLEEAQRLADAGRLEEAAAICEARLKAGRVSARAYYLLGLVRDA